MTAHICGGGESFALGDVGEASVPQVSQCQVRCAFVKSQCPVVGLTDSGRVAAQFFHGATTSPNVQVSDILS